MGKTFIQGFFQELFFLCQLVSERSRITAPLPLNFLNAYFCLLKCFEWFIVLNVTAVNSKYLVTFTILLLRHFAILGHKNAQTKAKLWMESGARK